MVALPFINLISDSLQKMAQRIQGQIKSGLGAELNTIFSSISERVKSAGDDINEVLPGIDELFSSFKGSIVGVKGDVKTAMDGITKAITDAMSGVGSKVKQQFSEGQKAAQAMGKTASSATGSVKDVDKEVKKSFGKKLLGGVKKIGGAIKGIFVSMGGAMGILGMIMKVLNALGILKPFMTILTAIIKIIGGKVIGALMPLIMQFIDILLGEDFMALFDAIAEVLIAVLVPVMEMIIEVLNTLAPYFPMFIDLIMMLAEAIGPLMDLLLGTPEFIALIIGVMWVLYGVIWAVIVVIKVIVFVWTFLRNVIITVIQAIILVYKFFEDLFKIFTGGGDIVKLFTKAIDDMLALFGGGGSKGKKQYGGMIPRTGFYHMEAGEEVKTTGDVEGANREQIELMEEMIDLQRKQLHYFRYEAGE